jgi:hypothetical protein
VKKEEPQIESSAPVCIILGEYFMTFLLFFAWYYIIKSILKLRKYLHKERLTGGDSHHSEKFMI